jgi:uncharacterized protein (TIGR00251 family)
MIIEAKVKANQPEFKVEKSEGLIIIHVTNPPAEGRANIEIIRELSRLTGGSVYILRGSKSRKKTIEIKALGGQEFLDNILR